MRGLVHGDVRCDDLFLEMYATDASLFQIRPLGVIRPRTTADVAAVVKYAAQQNIPIHPRGAGTGLAGESLGPGLIIDFSRYMRRILETREDSVRIQPGVVHARLNEHLRPLGKIFGPDPAMSAVTTMGSVIAIDNSGSHWLAYGSTRPHVLSLEVVLADGTILEVGRESLVEEPLHESALPEQFRKWELLEQLSSLGERNRKLIEAHQPRTLVNRAGYHLPALCEEQHLDLAKFLCGSEGTLALITEATIAIQPFPKHKAAALLLFSSLELAVQAVPELLKHKPCALELLDRRHLSLACEADARYAAMIPSTTEGILLIEFAGENQRLQQEQLRQTTDLIWKKMQLAFDARIAGDLEELRFFWRLMRRVMPTLQRSRGTARPVPFIEDVAIPPDALGDFLHRMQNTLKRHQVTASLYAHAGHGQLHIRPFLDLNQPSEVAKMDGLADDLYSEVLALGGTISGEHGNGLSRTPFVRKQYGPLYDVFGEVKRIFDPQGILNPGKLLSRPAQETETMLAHLRPGTMVAPALVPAEATASETPFNPNESAIAMPASDSLQFTTSALPVIQLQLNWSPQELLAETKNCNGCGLCRTQLPDQRMCPTFRIGPGEEASPRAKANLMRGIITGDLDAQLLSKAELKGIADLCVNCHQCRLECPTHVDIPKLMLEAKADYISTNGMRVSEWWLAHLDRVSRWASRFARISNWALGNRQVRWLLERTIGLAHNRKLPRLANKSFLSWAQRGGFTRLQRRGERQVLYFADTTVNYYDPQLGIALVQVLEHNGVGVYVPPEPLTAGMSLVSHGAMEAAKKLAAKNVSLLVEAVRAGRKIISAEPSTVLCLTRDYPHLLEDDDARLIADNTIEATEYLWRLHQQGALQLDLKPVHASVGYHQPCHSRAIQTTSAAENLLRLISGLQVQRLDKGCSGMAGTYGLSKDNFRNSLRAGRHLTDALRDSPLQAGATECTACKMQLEQAADKPTIHPIKWLALSYGLMPELEDAWLKHVPEGFVT